MTTSRQLVAYLVAVGLKSMADRELTAPDAEAIAAVVAAGTGMPVEAAEAIRQLMEMAQ